MPLQKSTLLFIEQLKQNNNREWFAEHKKDYDRAKADFTTLVARVMDLCGVGEKITGNTPEKMLFRIYRDVRFSKDKRPYKNNLAAVISPVGRKDELSGVYVHLEPREGFIASGLYAPTPEQLSAARQEIDYNAAKLLAIVNAASFKKYFIQIEGEKLSRPPKGYDAANEHIDLLKHKQFFVTTPIADNEWLTDGIEEKIADVYRTVEPFGHFFKQAIVGKSAV